MNVSCALEKEVESLLLCSVDSLHIYFLPFVLSLTESSILNTLIILKVLIKGACFAFLCIGVGKPQPVDLLPTCINKSLREHNNAHSFMCYE